MQAIPVKVKNVDVYVCFPKNEPLKEMVIEGATGTYSVGTLTTNIFYNLDLNNDGKRLGPLHLHAKYYAVFETTDGKKVTTPCMFCLNNSDTPSFGLTQSVIHDDDSKFTSGPLPAEIDDSDYVTLSALTDITVSQPFPPREPGEVLLIENGTGNIIATRVGTPHLMGVKVDTGDRVGKLIPGMKNVMISATAHYKDSNGESVSRPFSQTGLTVISGGEPAFFIKEFIL